RGHMDSADHMRLSLQLQNPTLELAYTAVIQTTVFPYLISESLRVGDEDVISTISVPGQISSWLEKLKNSRDERDAAPALACLNALADMQRVEPDPSILRLYSSSQSVRRIGERGENFAALVKSILGKEDLRSAYLSWLRQLTPMELDDVTILA